MLKEYQKHIMRIDEAHKKMSWCGTYIYDFAFLNIDHAVLNNEQKGRLLPCPKCVKVITKLLNVIG